MARTRKPVNPPTELKEPLASAELEENEVLEEDLQNDPGRVFDAATLLLCLVGIGISGYLTYTRFAHTIIPCFDNSSCETVNSSKYALLLGIPVATLGLLAYIMLLVGGITRLVIVNRRNEEILVWRWRLDLALFLVSLIGIAFTVYLKAMEIFVIGAICIWCVGSAITISLLFILYLIRFLRN